MENRKLTFSDYSFAVGFVGGGWLGYFLGDRKGFSALGVGLGDYPEWINVLPDQVPLRRIAIGFDSANKFYETCYLRLADATLLVQGLCAQVDADLAPSRFGGFVAGAAIGTALSFGVNLYRNLRR